ncbi:transcriptional regulator, Crp/Fnr family [Solidesulfovibrio carbinoliphilus subsp. oakridgensis]|uniref:Transcriptional regulator, Crp/Fnr family n=1 Tax=Solidesulfovibrio carbinoliphilus subsp. oakridgensis TaxID=694327 RepID=G7QA52_9BACT|nr:Crp/Fnr family transcriptional regulator [Solidesulfovibrio carbinoliphilus]EHJ47882.1 transcriptional regulator, Crp/Fnr family [Solidesulfovibrio carbinoliphilus subsp. oakridgensis]
MDLTARMVLLRSLPFFGGLPETRLTRLAAGAAVSSHAPGALIAGRDREGDAFYVVASGRARIFRMDREGREQTLYVLGPGEPFCLCSLVDAGEPPALAAALEPARVLAFPARALAEATREDPEVLFDLLKLLCRRLKEAMAMIESLALRDLPGRVAAFLLHQAAAAQPGQGAGQQVRLAVSQRELAKIVGATPEALSRVLRHLSEAGLLTVKGRDVTLRDRAGLAREAGLTPEGV